MPLRLLLLLLLCAGCHPRTPDQVVLLPGDGQLAVTTTQQTQVLTQPYATAAVRDDGRVQAGVTTEGAVQARYGPVLQTLPPAGTVYTLFFQTGTTTVTEASQTEVATLLAEVARRGTVEVQIEGHSDQQGTDAVNDPLALARAEAVWALLVQQGLGQAWVRVIGRGSRAPLVDRPGQPHERNRRVEVTVR